MSSYLQTQIQNRLEAKNLNIHSLEKKAGLKRSAARNIMQGFSKKPSADILKAIADVLECSLDDLVGPTNANISNLAKTTFLPKTSHSWNEKLYINVIKTISKILNDRKIEWSFEQIIALANESYKYSKSKKQDKIDQDFINWLVSRSI